MGLNMYVKRINKKGTLKEITKTKKETYKKYCVDAVIEDLKYIIEKNEFKIRDSLMMVFDLIELNLDTLETIAAEVKSITEEFLEYDDDTSFQEILSMQDKGINSILEEIFFKHVRYLLIDALKYRKKYEDMKKDGVIVLEEIAFFRKNYFVRNIIKEICEDTDESLVDDCYYNVILSEDNVKYIYNSLVEKKQQHLIVAELDVNYNFNSMLLKEGLKTFKYILDTTDFNNETIQYYDC